MTIQFVVQKLYVWKKHHVIQEKLVMWNLELQIAEGGTGLIPQWKLADASFATSWLQPLQTLALASQPSEIQLLNQWNNRSSALSMKLLQSSLGSLGYKSLHVAY